MTSEPRTQSEIYNSLRNSLTGKIAKLTNFTDRSFNYVWTQAFSQQVRELEVKALASEFAGYIDYAGGPITEEQLEDLDLDDDVDVEEINELMDDQQLDELVKIVGVSRDEGAKATGEVTFTTQTPLTTMPEGTRVTTPPDSSGETIDFLTTQEVQTIDGETNISGVPIEAIEVGEEYNVTSNNITRVSNPPVGVRSVNNPISTTGGEDREENDELRARAKNAVGGASEGGTVEGIKSYLRNTIGPVSDTDVVIDEFTDVQPPYVDVIVDGGLDQEVKNAIEFSRPTGIRHNLVRPEVVEIGVEAQLQGSDVNYVTVENAVTDFLLNLGIGDTFYKDALIREIMTSDDDIINIERLDASVQEVNNETFLYTNSQSDYPLDFTLEDTNGSISISDADGVSYDRGSDYTVEDQTGDGWPETIVWGGGNTPADNTSFYVNYDVTVPDQTLPENEYDIDLVRDERFTFSLGEVDTFEFDTGDPTYNLDAVPFDGTLTVEDDATTVYTQKIDWQLIPQTNNPDTDIFEYSSGTTDYALTDQYSIGDISINDNDENIYIQGGDYIVEDTDGDSIPDTVSFDVPTDGSVADDGGTTTDETTAANNSTADDMTLLPASPTTGDAYYFAKDEIFGGIELDVSTAGDGTWTIVWEYYDGGSWTSLSNVTDDTDGFQNGGPNAVTFDKETDWAETSVAGLGPYYWIRARVDSFSSINTQPLGETVSMGLKPDNSDTFTVNYNGFARTIRWDPNYSSPSDGQDFTGTYDKQIYPTDLEVQETPEGLIRDESGDVYNEDTEYIFVDYDNDSELEAVKWNTNPATLDDDEEFYVTYITEGDIPLTDRKKADPGNIEISEAE